MKPLFHALLIAAALQFAGLSANAAEAAEAYQVTGPILEITEKAIVVQKGDERWEIARDEKTKIDGDLKVGNKVTIHYRMVAVSVESKSDAKKKSK